MFFDICWFVLWAEWGLVCVAPLERCDGAITGANKDGDYPANSLYEILKRRHGEAEE